MCDSSTLIQIKRITKNEIPACDNQAALDAFSVDIENQKTSGNDIKLCFSFNDVKTNISLGFFSLSLAHEYDDVGYIFSIMIDSLHINQQGINSKWKDMLYLHLTDVVYAALNTAKSTIIDPKHELDFNVVVLENPELEEMLCLVVNSACIDLSITDRIAV